MIETKEAPLDHQLASQQQHPELTDGHENPNRPYAGHLTSDGALIANPIYGEMPAPNPQGTVTSETQPKTNNSKYPKQDTGTLDRIREYQAPIREQKALAAAAAEVDTQAIAELQEIVNNPPPTAAEQLKETWQRLSTLVRSIKIIDVQPIQDLPPSPVAQKLDEAEKIFEKLKSTSTPISPEEEREIDRIAREKVSPQLAAENVASDVAHAIEGTITDSHMDDESVRKLVREYMASHTNIEGDRNRIEQRTYERIVNKLAARRINEKAEPSKTGFITKISVEPIQPTVISPSTLPSSAIANRPTETTTEAPVRTHVNVEAAATNIIQRLQTDTTRSFETEETRRHRELQATNPEAVAGQTLPLHHENVDEMINRNLDAYLMNQRAGTANDETRAAIIARVRKGAQDRIALIERTNTVAQRILKAVNARPDAATVNTAVDTYLAEHLGDQNLNRNELVQRTQTLLAQRPAPAPEAPTPPDDKTTEPPKNPVLSEYLTKLARDLSITAMGEIRKGNTQAIDDIINRQVKVYETVNGPLNPATRPAVVEAIRRRTQELQIRHEQAATPAPETQKKPIIATEVSPPSSDTVPTVETPPVEAAPPLSDAQRIENEIVNNTFHNPNSPVTIHDVNMYIDRYIREHGAITINRDTLAQKLLNRFNNPQQTENKPKKESLWGAFVKIWTGR